MRAFAVGTLGGEEGVCAEVLRTRMRGGTSLSAGVDGGCLVEGGVTQRVVWLWRADGRFSRE